MKKILTTAVFAMALAMVANAYDKTVSTFETENVAENFASFASGAAWTATDYSSYAGLLPSETNSTKYLEVSTDAPLVRRANTTGAAVDVVGNFYIDMMAKFNETESAVVDNEDKLALYMNVNGNLVVVAGANTNSCETTTSLVPGAWYRVAIHMIQNIYGSGDARPGFVVSINGVDVAAKSDSYMELSGLTPTAQEYYNARQLFPSIKTGAQITSLAISGVGGVDDIVFADTKNTDSSIVNPWAGEENPPAEVTYTVVDANGNTAGSGNVKTIDYSTLGTGTYSVQASADGKGAVNVGDPVGVLAFENLAAGKQKLISVPWKSADKKNVRVADMFYGAVEDDIVAFYHNGYFRNFTYTDGVWMPDSEAIADGYTTESVFEPGTAALYTPATTHTIKLVGIAQAGTTKAPEANAWSALGSTVVTNTPIANILANVPESAKATGTKPSTAKDKIAVQNGNGYKFYFIGSDGKVKNMFSGTDSTDNIAPGSGFMYLSTSGEVPDVKFGN